MVGIVLANTYVHTSRIHAECYVHTHIAKLSWGGQEDNKKALSVLEMYNHLLVGEPAWTDCGTCAYTCMHACSMQCLTTQMVG